MYRTIVSRGPDEETRTRDICTRTADVYNARVPPIALRKNAQLAHKETRSPPGILVMVAASRAISRESRSRESRLIPCRGLNPELRVCSVDTHTRARRKCNTTHTPRSYVSRRIAVPSRLGAQHLAESKSISKKNVASIIIIITALINY